MALNWLSCADPSVKHAASRELHQPGSNHWVLELDEFKGWKEHSGQVFWLHGIPGAGKTGMCPLGWRLSRVPRPNSVRK